MALDTTFEVLRKVLYFWFSGTVLSSTTSFAKVLSSRWSTGNPSGYTRPSVANPRWVCGWVVSLHSESRGLEASFLDREKSFSASSCPSHPQDSDRPVQGSSCPQDSDCPVQGSSCHYTLTLQLQNWELMSVPDPCLQPSALVRTIPHHQMLEVNVESDSDLL